MARRKGRRERKPSDPQSPVLGGRLEAASTFGLASVRLLLGCREDWDGGERRSVSKEGGEVWVR